MNYISDRGGKVIFQHKSMSVLWPGNSTWMPRFFNGSKGWKSYLTPTRVVRCCSGTSAIGHKKGQFLKLSGCRHCFKSEWLLLPYDSSASFAWPHFSWRYCLHRIYGVQELSSQNWLCLGLRQMWSNWLCEDRAAAKRKRKHRRSR